MYTHIFFSSVLVSFDLNGLRRKELRGEGRQRLEHGLRLVTAGFEGRSADFQIWSYDHVYPEERSGVHAKDKWDRTQVQVLRRILRKTRTKVSEEIGFIIHYLRRSE